MAFSKPFYQYGSKQHENHVYKSFWRKFDQEHNFPEVAGEKIRMHFDFNTAEGEQVKIKFALSPVSTRGALANMQAEIPHWDFERVKQKGQALWNNELNKIVVDAGSHNEMVNFYTAMYHAFLGPTTYMDVDGSYRGIDMNIHKADGFTNYSSFSLWDTYRTLHPFFNLVQPRRNTDMIKSMLAHYDQSVHKWS